MENAKKDYLVTTFMQKAWDKYQTLGWNLWEKPEQLIDDLCSLDPTGERLVYGKWIVSLFIKKSGNFEGELLEEDVLRIADVLATFERVKAHLPADARDINRYKSIQDLYVVLDPFENKDVQSQRAIKRNKKDAIWQQIDEVYDSSTVSIYIPKTFDASAFLGRGSKWCTAATKENGMLHDGPAMFSSYASDGPLYVIFIKKEKDAEGRQIKFQFSLARGQYMNVMDRPIVLKDVVKKYPDIRKYFSQHITMAELAANRGGCFPLSKWDSEKDFSPSEKIQYAIVVDLKAITKYVNRADFTVDMMIEICKAKGEALEYLVKDTRMTEEVILAALRRCPSAVSYVKDDPRLTPNCMLTALQKDGSTLEYLIRDKRLTSDMINAALSAPEGSAKALKAASKDKRLTPENIIAAIKGEPKNIQILGEHPNLPVEVLKMCMKKDSRFVASVIARRLKLKLPVPDEIVKYAREQEWID